MPTSALSVSIQHLLADLRPDGDGRTDGELLTRFVRGRDGDALATLVRRHAPMVWGVCRHLLRNTHDAEDAFQATFLVLVRKAAGVPGHAVPNWLYGVARQTAVRVRATAAKRGRRETQVVTMPEPAMPEVRDADLQNVVDEELSRLPGHYRGVVILCDLEGMTRKEAARQLGLPEGSVASRLARARALLAKRLNRRGVTFSGSVAAVSSAGSASSVLVASTIRAAHLLAAGQASGVVSAKVAALTEGVMQAMFTTKIKSVVAVLIVGLALAGGAGLIYHMQVADQPKPKGEPPAAKNDQKERPMTKEEKLRVLIDKVLAAHGGEEKLGKLMFTDKVLWTSEGNVMTLEHFVAPPTLLRIESQKKGEQKKEICILLEDGLKRWVKYPNEKAVQTGNGRELPVEYYHDDIKFSGPRLVLRLKDADQQISLLDDTKIDGRPAVGVEINKVVAFTKLSLKLYFDEKTSLLVKMQETHSKTEPYGFDMPTKQFFYKDYKSFDGIQVAMRAEQSNDGKVVLVTEVADFRAVDKFDATLFEQP